MAFECNICKKTFSTGGHRARHLRQVHGGERHTCHQCGKSFTQQEKLQAHLKKCQTQWSCPTCGQDFGSLLAFNRHKTMQHPELMPRSMASKKRKGESRVDNTYNSIDGMPRVHNTCRSINVMLCSRSDRVEGEAGPQMVPSRRRRLPNGYGPCAA